MFERQISFASVHASTAVLTMADGLQGGLRMPVLIGSFMRVQASMVGNLSLVLRLGRVTAFRLLESGAENTGATSTKL